MAKQIKPYTKRQQGIIDGSVAYEDVHGQEYCAIIKKATAMKDEELVARMRELHAKKKEEYRFRNNEANKRRYHKYGKYHTGAAIRKTPTLPLHQMFIWRGCDPYAVDLKATTDTPKMLFTIIFHGHLPPMPRRQG